MRTCPDCLSFYKASSAGKKARKAGGAWGRGLWPAQVYHNEKTAKCQKHHAQGLADCAARRAGLRHATPKWVDRSAIRAIYEECLKRTKETGIQHEVDHIVPLAGVNVRGLHVPWNLQVIRASVNRTKSNKF